MNRRKEKRFKKATKLLAVFIISLPVLLAGITANTQHASALPSQSNFPSQSVTVLDCITGVEEALTETIGLDAARAATNDDEILDDYCGSADALQSERTSQIINRGCVENPRPIDLERGFPACPDDSDGGEDEPMPENCIPPDFGFNPTNLPFCPDDSDDGEDGEEDEPIPADCIPSDVVPELDVGNAPFCPTEPEPDPVPPTPTPVYTGETCYEQVGNPLEVTLYRPVLCTGQPDDTPNNPVNPETPDTPVTPTPELDSTQLKYDDLVVHTFSYLSTRSSHFGYSNCPNGGISYGAECGIGSIFNSSVPGDVSGSVAANICRQANTRAQAGKTDPNYGTLVDFEGYEGGKAGLKARVEGTELSRFSAEELWVAGYTGGEIPVNTDGDRVTPVVSGLGDCARTRQDTLVKSGSPGSTPSDGLDGLAFNILAEKDAAVAAGNDPPANSIALVRVRTYCPTNVAFVGVDVLKFGKMAEYHNLRNHARFDEISEALEHDTFRVCVFDRTLLENHLRELGKTDTDVAADLQRFDDLVYGRPTYVYVAPNPLPDVEPPELPAVDASCDHPASRNFGSKDYYISAIDTNLVGYEGETLNIPLRLWRRDSSITSSEMFNVQYEWAGAYNAHWLGVTATAIRQTGVNPFSITDFGGAGSSNNGKGIASGGTTSSQFTISNDRWLNPDGEVGTDGCLHEAELSIPTHIWENSDRDNGEDETYAFVMDSGHSPNYTSDYEPVNITIKDGAAPTNLIVKVPGWFWFASDSSNPSGRLPVTGQPFSYVDGDDPTGQSINSPIEFGFGAELFDGHPDPNYEYFDNEGPALHTLVGLNSWLNRELNYSISVGHMGGRLDVHTEIDTANAPAREWHHIKYSVSEETQDRIDMGEFTISFDPPETIITVCNRYLYPDCWAQQPYEPPLPPPPTTTTTTIPRIDRSSMHTTRDEVSINVAESVRTGAAARVEFLANDQCRVAVSSANRCTSVRPTIRTQPSEGAASIVSGGLGGWQLEYTPHAWANGRDLLRYSVEVDGDVFFETVSVRFTDVAPRVESNNEVIADIIHHPYRSVFIQDRPHTLLIPHYWGSRTSLHGHGPTHTHTRYRLRGKWYTPPARVSIDPDTMEEIVTTFEPRRYNCPSGWTQLGHGQSPPGDTEQCAVISRQYGALEISSGEDTYAWDRVSNVAHYDYNEWYFTTEDANVAHYHKEDITENTNWASDDDGDIDWGSYNLGPERLGGPEGFHDTLGLEDSWVVIPNDIHLILCNGFDNRGAPASRSECDTYNDVNLFSGETYPFIHGAQPVDKRGLTPDDSPSPIELYAVGTEHETTRCYATDTNDPGIQNGHPYSWTQSHSPSIPGGGIPRSEEHSQGASHNLLSAQAYFEAKAGARYVDLTYDHSPPPRCTDWESGRRYLENSVGSPFEDNAVKPCDDGTPGRTLCVNWVNHDQTINRVDREIDFRFRVCDLRYSAWLANGSPLGYVNIFDSSVPLSSENTYEDYCSDGMFKIGHNPTFDIAFPS